MALVGKSQPPNNGSLSAPSPMGRTCERRERSRKTLQPKKKHTTSHSRKRPCRGESDVCVCFSRKNVSQKKQTHTTHRSSKSITTTLCVVCVCFGDLSPATRL